MCVVCNQNKESPIVYTLNDNTTINICTDCGKIVYGVNLSPSYPDRLFHIINLIEYVKLYTKLNERR